MEIPAYYALFELPVRLLLDETLLRSRFLALKQKRAKNGRTGGLALLAGRFGLSKAQ